MTFKFVTSLSFISLILGTLVLKIECTESDLVLGVDRYYRPFISTYMNTKMSVCLFVCSRFSRPFRNRLAYHWHKVSFRWDSESEWESEWDSRSESGSQTGSQSGSDSGSGCESESEEESE